MLDKNQRNSQTIEENITKEEMEKIGKETVEKIKNEDKNIPEYPSADPNENPEETVSGDKKTD